MDANLYWRWYSGRSEYCHLILHGLGPRLGYHRPSTGVSRRGFRNLGVLKLKRSRISGDEWSGIVTFASLSTAASNKDTPSPRFWLLWPGVLLMIAVSFTELALQYKVIYYVFKAVFRGSCAGMAAMLRSMKKESPWLEKHGEQKEEVMVTDTAEDYELVKWWMWAPLLVVVIICEFTLKLLHGAG